MKNEENKLKPIEESGFRVLPSAFII